MRDLTRAVKQLERQLALVSTQQGELLDRIGEVRTANHSAVLAQAQNINALAQKIEELGLRERQLRAVQRADGRFDRREADPEPDAPAAIVVTPGNPFGVPAGSSSTPGPAPNRDRQGRTARRVTRSTTDRNRPSFPV